MFIDNRHTKLKQLHQKFEIPLVRKPPPADTTRALVLDQMANDPRRQNGPVTVGRLLANEGWIIPR